MKRSIIISVHAAYWLVYFFLTVSTLVVAGSNFNGDIYQSILLNFLLSVTCFYVFYLSLVPKLLAQQKITQFGLLAVLTAFSSAVLIVLLQAIITQGGRSRSEIPYQSSDIFPMILNWIFVIVFHTIIGVIHGVLASFMKGFFFWYDGIHIKEMLEKKNLETQMALIKARIDPHFLFNTLNNIDVLINSDQSAASLYLQKLCNILRFTLYENYTEYIPLQKEIEITKEYIELQRIRSARDFISVEITGDPDGKLIAPMILMPFVENAIKHSDGRKTDRSIIIKIDIQNSTINFICRNIIAVERKQTEGGIGMDLVKTRLNLLYGNNHQMGYTEKDGYFEVRLTITTR